MEDRTLENVRAPTPTRRITADLARTGTCRTTSLEESRSGKREKEDLMPIAVSSPAPKTDDDSEEPKGRCERCG